MRFLTTITIYIATMKQYTPLGNWLYRVRLKDGTFGIIDAALPYHKREAFRIPEAEIDALRENYRLLNEEKNSLLYLASGYREPRKRISEKAQQRIAEIDALFEAGKPLSDEYKAYQDRQYELGKLHDTPRAWYDQWKDMNECRAILRAHGYDPSARLFPIDFKRALHDDAIPGVLFISRQGHRPFLTVRTPGVPSGLLGHGVYKENFAESVFHPGTAPAREPAPEEILAPLIGHVVETEYCGLGSGGSRALLVRVDGHTAIIRWPLRNRRKFAVKETRYRLHHPEQWKLAV